MGLMAQSVVRFYQWLKRLCATRLDFSAVRFAIVRRYTDANGHYIGELYLELPDSHGYRMIGVSLDSLPLAYTGGKHWKLDTANDFLAPMPKNTVRVGAVDPDGNDYTRSYVASLPKWDMSLMIQNRFIEYILESKKL